MKIFFTILCAFLSVTAFSQTKKEQGYFSPRAGMLFGGGHTAKPILGFSMGPLIGNEFGVGIGVAYIREDNPYIPITLDFTYYGKPEKITPILACQIGYAIYKNAIIIGGTYGSIQAGISLPAAKRAKLFVMGGYCLQGFSVTVNRRKATEHDENFMAMIGVKL